ncbi:MAG TPA: hypothetical protein DF383_13000 [Deltaproteobacteria bacterium]|nr:hypothetical protein [Deltaproteobacteria bacterium]
MKKNIFLTALILTLATGACTKKQNTTAPSPDTKPITTESAARVGVPECDDYLNKYEQCINEKVPERARAGLQEAFEQTRLQWKGMAADETKKAALAAACQEAATASKSMASTYGCEF